MCTTVFTQYDLQEDWCTEQKDVWLDWVKTFSHRPIRCLITIPPEINSNDFGFCLELIGRFEFEFRRRGTYFLKDSNFWFVQSSITHTMWPSMCMCMCCGLFVLTQPPKRNKSPPSKGTSTNNYTTASPTHPLNKPSSFHNPLHTLVHTSCSQEVKHMRLRIVAFVFQLPED